MTAFLGPELYSEFSVKEIPSFLAEGINLQAAETIKNTYCAVDYGFANISNSSLKMIIELLEALIIPEIHVIVWFSRCSV